MKKEEKLEILLTYLVKHKEDWVSGKQLNEYIQISPRQLRNYVNEWNLRCPGLILSSEHGYFVDPAAYESYLHQKQELYSVEKRQYHILERICYSKTGLDLTDLEHEVHISHPSLEADITALKICVKAYNIHILRKQERIQLSGKESDIRKLLCHFYDKQLYARFFIAEDSFQSTCRMAAASLQAHKLYFDEQVLSNLCIYLIIACQRIHAGFGLEEAKQDNQYENLARLLLETICQQPSLPSAELAYLSRLISHTKPCEVQVSELSKACEQLQLELQLDFHPLFNQLLLWYQKHKREQTYFSSFQERGNLSTFTYPLADFMAQRLISYLPISMTWKARYDLSLLFASEMDQLYQKEKIQALFVYQNLDGNEHRMMEAMIQLCAPELSIIKQIPWYDYNPAIDTTELIICNGNLMFSHTNVTIHPVLNEKDRTKLRYVVTHQLHKKRRSGMIHWLRNVCELDTATNAPMPLDDLMIMDQGFPLYYHPHADHSYLHIMMGKTHMSFFLGIASENGEELIQYYDDLIALISDITYQKMLISAQDKEDFLQRIDQALSQYHRKLEKAIMC